MHRLSWLPVAFLAILQLSGCVKNPSPDKFEFSFTFNGVTYSNPDFGFVSFTLGELTQIEIRKPDILGGLIRIYWTPNCGFLEPTGMTDYASSNQVSFNYNTCTYMTFGVIDTSKIFWLSSGSKDFNLSNCKHKRVPAFPGWDEYDECTAEGSFSFVLINNAGIAKNISGTFRLPGVRR